MPAQAKQLVAHGGFGNPVVGRVLPLVPFFPVVAAAQAGHDENSLAIGQLVQVVGFELALEANRVQAQVEHVGQLVAQPLGIFAQHHVGRPATAADQDALAVDRELALLV